MTVDIVKVSKKGADLSRPKAQRKRNEGQNDLRINRMVEQAVLIAQKRGQRPGKRPSRDCRVEAYCKTDLLNVVNSAATELI